MILPYVEDSRSRTEWKPSGKTGSGTGGENSRRIGWLNSNNPEVSPYWWPALLPLIRIRTTESSSCGLVSLRPGQLRVKTRNGNTQDFGHQWNKCFQKAECKAQLLWWRFYANWPVKGREKQA